MKSLFRQWFPVVSAVALVAVTADDIRLHRSVQEYRAIGTMLTEEEKPAEFFLNQYRERVRQQNNKFRDEHALMCLGIAAHMGNGSAMVQLTNHLSDRGQKERAERFYTAERAWLKKAAEQGEPDHQYLYASHIGFPIMPWETCLTAEERADRYADLQEAFELYRKAAEQGYRKAQKKLAQYYLYGYGCEKNLDEALRWSAAVYEAELEEGSEPYEAPRLGEIYLEMGKPELALPLLERSAARGHPRGMKLYYKVQELLNHPNTAPTTEPCRPQGATDTTSQHHQRPRALSLGGNAPAS